MSIDQKTLDDKPAFPSVDDPYHPGLTKREYMATAIMAALMEDHTTFLSNAAATRMAKNAVQAAEALLVELAK